MDASELLARSAVEQAALVRSGEIEARELVEAALASIERHNPGLNAFVALCPERALAEADEVRPGDPRPFCGVQVGVKDLLNATRDLPCSEGSRAFGDWVADHDSAHVRRLREAGAIVVGRTNTPELGLRPVTENARFGPTRNPWSTGLSAGGSSGGSAAAVAAGMVAICDGSDLGGSIRIPASCCGLVGLKPSLGRVSIGPDFGDFTSGTVADGVLTRTVLDAATALDAIAGSEPGDRRGPLAAVTGLADATRHDPGRMRVRVALAAPGGLPVDNEPRAAAVFAAETLARLGHDVDEQAPDWESKEFAADWTTFATGTAQQLLRVAERLHGRPANADLLEPATRTWLVDSEPVALVDWFEAGEGLWAFGRRLLSGWRQDELLLTPTLTRLPAEIGGLEAQGGVTDDATRFSAFVRVWNVTGQPAISLPLHRTADGLPVGVQLVGPPGRDDLLLAVAAQLEAAVGWPHVAPALEQAAA